MDGNLASTHDDLMTPMVEQMDAMSIKSHSTTGEDLMDLEIQPHHLLDTIINLQSILEAAVSTLSFLKDMKSNRVYINLENTFRDLYGKTHELERIADSYVSEARFGDGLSEMYMDPGVMKWLTDCMICLLSIQANVDDELDSHSKALKFHKGSVADNRDSPGSTVETFDDDDDDEWTFVDTQTVSEGKLSQDRARLQEFIDRLAVFLPFMTAELGEYHIAESYLDTTQTSPVLRPLRYHLYQLKDEVRQSVNLLLQFIKLCPPPLAAQFKSNHGDFERLHMRLTEYLTNDGSDWLTSLLNGGLSFSQFRQISVKDVSSDTQLMRVLNKEFDTLITYRSRSVSRFDDHIPCLKEATSKLVVFNPFHLSKVKVQLDNLNAISVNLKKLLKLAT